MGVIKQTVRLSAGALLMFIMIMCMSIHAGALSVGDKEILDDNVNFNDILNNGSLSYNKSEKVLTIKGNVDLSKSQYADLFFDDEGSTLLVEKDCTLTGYITAKKSLTITGSGKLTINYHKGTQDDPGYGIRANKSLSINNAKLQINGAAYGIMKGSSSSKLSVNNSSVTISATSNAINILNSELIDCQLTKGSSTTDKSIVISSKAASYGINIGDTVVTENNYKDVLGNGRVSYDPSGKVLTIKGDIDLSGNSLKAITISDNSTTINTTANSKLTGTISSTKPLTFKGSGTLTIAPDSKREKTVSVDDKITLSSANLVISGATYGIYAKTAEINNSNVTITSYEDAIWLIGKSCTMSKCFVSKPSDASYSGFTFYSYGDEVTNLTINNYDLKYAKVSLQYTAYTYKEGGISADNYLTVTMNGKTLVNGTDYTTSYSNASKVGYQTCTLTITGKGNYSGSVTRKLTVKPAQLAKPTLTTQNGAITVNWKKTTTDGLAYQVIYDKIENFNTSAAKHTTDYHTTTITNLNTLTKNLTAYTKPGETWYVKVRCFITDDGTINGTRYGTLSKAAKIVVKGNLKSASIPYSSYTYTGNEIKPDLTVKDTKGTKLTSSDYTAAYSNNIKLGTAKITITGKGNYQGTLTKTFIIKPAKNAIIGLTSSKANTFTVKYSSATAGATGYQILYCKNSSFDPSDPTYHSTSVTNLSTLSKTVSSNVKSGETWYVKVRSYIEVNGTRYGNYSDVKHVIIK